MTSTNIAHLVFWYNIPRRFIIPLHLKSFRPPLAFWPKADLIFVTLMQQTMIQQLDQSLWFRRGRTKQRLAHVHLLCEVPICNSSRDCGILYCVDEEQDPQVSERKKSPENLHFIWINIFPVHLHTVCLFQQQSVARKIRASQIDSLKWFSSNY